jgi:putative ABC transport system permease protein
MQNLLQNLRYVFRALCANIGLTFTILLTIALGIGANTAIFTVVYATLLAPSPYPRPDRLVNVWSQLQGHRNFASVGDFTDWKRKNSAFQDLNAASTNNIIVGTQDRPEFLGTGSHA